MVIKESAFKQKVATAWFKVRFWHPQCQDVPWCSRVAILLFGISIIFLVKVANCWFS